MTLGLYLLLLRSMLIIAVVVFLCLFFVKAGYGIFHSAQWGVSVNNKLGWVVMEAPVFFVMLWIWVAESRCSTDLPQFLMLLLFELHYFQRSFIFPFLMKGKSRMPISIILMGVIFNVINGLMQGYGLYVFPSVLYDFGPRYLLRWNAWLGIVIFLAGFAINLHSDHCIRSLRKEGDTNHYLPARGLYKYVTSANYFGELLEWAGFALLAFNPASLVFVWWTAANLVPRANAIHKRYREEFGNEAVGNRKRIIPFVY